MKLIQTHGITNIQALEHSGGWYWGSDYAGGDLYEAEERFQSGHDIGSNRLIFLHYPDGCVAEPIKARHGQYFGDPVFYRGRSYLLMVDFPKETILVWCCEMERQTVHLVVELPLSSVPNCYNLMLWSGDELMLLRQGDENRFQSIWPEKADFPVDGRETFYFKQGDKLYFSRWEEDPDYREEAVVRAFPTGEIQQVVPGSLYAVPDGQYWLLR